MDVADQAGHELAQARAGLGAHGADHAVCEGGIIGVIGGHFDVNVFNVVSDIDVCLLIR